MLSYPMNKYIVASVVDGNAATLGFTEASDIKEAIRKFDYYPFNTNYPFKAKGKGNIGGVEKAAFTYYNVSRNPDWSRERMITIGLLDDPEEEIALDMIIEISGDEVRVYPPGHLAAENSDEPTIVTDKAILGY